MRLLNTKNIILFLLSLSIIFVIGLLVIYSNPAKKTENITNGESSSSVVSSSDTSEEIVYEEPIMEESSSSSIDPTTDGKFKILFTGDNMLGRSVGERISKGENPYVHVMDFLKSYELVYVNFETSMGDSKEGSPQKGKAYTFRAPLRSMEVLKEANISILGLANNHIRDYGANVITSMMSRFDENGFTYFGVGRNIEDAFKVKYLEYEGTKIAFFGVNAIEGVYNNVGKSTAGAAYFDEGRIKTAIKDARSKADIVIVFPHWGKERVKTSNEFQEKWGKIFVDNGADLVIGMHAHVIQNVGIYKGKYIYYSLGNYVFEEDPAVDTGLNVELSIEDKKMKEIKEYEVKISGSYPTTVTERKTIPL
jgi:poly-gamma-glutamate synthesis protein (capsule biosynthesis protein)